MVAAAINGGNDVTKKINIFCLLAAIAIVLILPFKKEIWYDETVSMLCSKGISHDTPAEYAKATRLSSIQIEQLNTSANVFKATVIDNANSFLYNYKLHWFTQIFGNSLASYMLLSKLCAIITLIAFYALSRQFFKHTLFTGIAVLLLATDLNFINMSHEIRAYAMGTMFVVLAAVFFFRFLWQPEKPVYLFLASLFFVGALLAHFLTVYIVAVFLCALLILKGRALFTAKNILAIAIPLIPLGLFFSYAYDGLQVMNTQSEAIGEGYAKLEYHTSEAFLRSMKNMAINFKVVFPFIRDNGLITITSFLFVIVLYFLGLWSSTLKHEKRNLHLLFASGTSSAAMLLILSIRSHHYTSLYFRYHSFALPFCALFIGYVLYVLYNSDKIKPFIRVWLPFVFIIPSAILFVAGIAFSSVKPSFYQRYVYKATEIVENNQTSVKVQKWEEAFLIQSLLPRGYKIVYFRAD